MNVATIGVDLAKSAFQLHGIDAGGEVVFRKKLRRSTQDGERPDLPPIVYTALESPATQLDALSGEIRRLERRPLVVGATSVVRRAGRTPSATGVWIRNLLKRKPPRRPSLQRQCN